MPIETGQTEGFEDDRGLVQVGDYGGNRSDRAHRLNGLQRGGTGSPGSRRGELRGCQHWRVRAFDGGCAADAFRDPDGAPAYRAGHERFGPGGLSLHAADWHDTGLCLSAWRGLSFGDFDLWGGVCFSVAGLRHASGCRVWDPTFADDKLLAQVEHPAFVFLLVSPATQMPTSR